VVRITGLVSDAEENSLFTFSYPLMRLFHSCQIMFVVAYVE